MLPKGVQDILQDVDARLTEELVFGEGIGLITICALQVSPNDRGRKLALPHRDCQTEREDRIDETMRVPDADESLSAKPVHLVGVVRDHMDVFDQFDLGNSTAQVRVKFTKFSNEKIAFALLFVQKVRGWAYDADTDDLVIERDEPCPVVFFLVEDQCVILVSLALPAVVPHCIDHL